MALKGGSSQVLSLKREIQQPGTAGAICQGFAPLPTFMSKEQMVMTVLQIGGV